MPEKHIKSEALNCLKTFKFKIISGKSGLIIFVTAFLIRLIHNAFILNDPLYYFPIGGHLPYIIAAEKIAAGSLFPFDAPFSINSPYYPYILGVLFFIFGIGNFLSARLVGIFADSLTCVMAAKIAGGSFGKRAGVIAGLITAVYGPLIFYSAELTAVPYTLFFLVSGMLLLLKNQSRWAYLLSGLLTGAAIGTRPNLIIYAIMAAVIVFFKGKTKKAVHSGLLTSGLIIAVIPITIANYSVSGKFIPLTTSAGHNLYFGHNPDSSAGYAIPEQLDGDIFYNMKKLAENVEERIFDDSEVSGYYTRKAVQHIIHNPVKELVNTCKKLFAAVNSFEATTYANYYYQQEYSPVLSLCPGFGVLFPFAFMGIIIGPRKILVLVPVLATFITICMFFYIARLRMPMVPFLAVFAANAVSTLYYYSRNRDYKKVFALLTAVICLGILCNIKTAVIDTSNEWNKAGVVLRAQGKYKEAEKAFFRAIDKNDRNRNSYLNLMMLYKNNGQTEKASEMERKAQQCSSGMYEQEFFNFLYKN